MADAFDHAGVVAGIGQDHHIRDPAAQRRQRRPVRHIAAGEQQRRLLAVQIGQFGLQQQVVVIGAGNVARAARPGAAGLHAIDHRLHHGGVLAHAEIIVRAPDGDVAKPCHPCGCRRAGRSPRLRSSSANDAVVAFGFQRIELAVENLFKVHWRPRDGLFAGQREGLRAGIIQRHSFSSGSGSTMNQCSSRASRQRQVSRA